MKFVDFIIYSQQYIIIYMISSFDQSFDFCCSLLTTLSLISRKWIIILYHLPDFKVFYLPNETTSISGRWTIIVSSVVGEFGRLQFGHLEFSVFCFWRYCFNISSTVVDCFIFSLNLRVNKYGIGSNDSLLHVLWNIFTTFTYTVVSCVVLLLLLVSKFFFVCSKSGKFLYNVNWFGVLLSSLRHLRW